MRTHCVLRHCSLLSNLTATTNVNSFYHPPAVCTQSGVNIVVFAWPTDRDPGQVIHTRTEFSRLKRMPGTMWHPATCDALLCPRRAQPDLVAVWRSHSVAQKSQRPSDVDAYVNVLMYPNRGVRQMCFDRKKTHKPTDTPIRVNTVNCHSRITMRPIQPCRRVTHSTMTASMVQSHRIE